PLLRVFTEAGWGQSEKDEWGRKKNECLHYEFGRDSHERRLLLTAEQVTELDNAGDIIASLQTALRDWYSPFPKS
ncbi:MAG: hypothetical protein Q8R12_01360, partial [bacterium]|nr:hypothetical protein [bacterium]